MTDELNKPVDQPSEAPASAEAIVQGEQPVECPVAGPEGASQLVPDSPQAAPAPESFPDSEVGAAQAAAAVPVANETSADQPAEGEPVHAEGEMVETVQGCQDAGGGEGVTSAMAAAASATESAPSETPAEAPAESPNVAEAAGAEPAGAEPAGTEPAAAEASVEEAPVTVVRSGKPAKRSSAGGKKSAKKAEATPVPQGPKSDKMQWYILKVQSNREESIREGLLRRIAIAGLDQYLGDVIVPVEKVTEFKGGKRRVTKRKLYPGYLVVQMEINEDTWFVVRETPGIGDFTGASGHPTTMQPHEVARILAKKDEKTDEQPKLDIKFRAGDRVKINEGTFDNFEGEVDSIDQTNGRVTVMINIFGRSTPVELEYWQIESL